MTFHLLRRLYGRLMFRTIGLSSSLALLATVCAAQDSQRIDNLDAALLSGWQTPAGSHMAGLQLTLAPGWKTYWRSPGDAGIPPFFDWSGSENLKSVRLHWPSPSVFQTNGIQSIGYHDRVTLPFEVTPLDPAKPVRLHATVELGVCKDICTPASLNLTALLVAPGAPDASIQSALASQPRNATSAGLSAVSCRVDPIADGLKITAVMMLPASGGAETVVFEAGQPDIWTAQATTSRDGEMLTSVTEMVAPSGVPFALDRSQIRLTVLANDTAVEILGCPAP